MAEKTAVAVQGDMLDLVVWRATGKGSGLFEAMLEDPRNYGICELPEVVPVGTRVLIPATPEVIVMPTVSLWD